MYTIKIQNECECFKKSELTNNMTLLSQTSAVMQVMKMLNQMNNTFCKKHNFIVEEEYDNFVIGLDQTKTVTNCCGNGCCS